jgi:hypothetical protein
METDLTERYTVLQVQLRMLTSALIIDQEAINEVKAELLELEREIHASMEDDAL